MESHEREARAMPNHPESERSVLGAMLRSNEAALLVLESLTEDGQRRALRQQCARLHQDRR